MSDTMIGTVPDMSIEIIPTCVPRTRDDLHTEITKIHRFAESVHIDINDGNFAPGKTWPFGEGSTVGEFDISQMNAGVFDVHLMVSDPREIGENFIKAGARSIIAHIESFADENQLEHAISAWRALDVPQIGLAVLLGTPLKNIEHAIPSCDFVHIMSVLRIGAQGSPFDNRAIERVADIRDHHPDLPIAVDGGVAPGNITSLLRAGATRFAIGADIMHAADPSLEYAQLKSLVEHAL